MISSIQLKRSKAFRLPCLHVMISVAMMMMNIHVHDLMMNIYVHDLMMNIHVHDHDYSHIMIMTRTRLQNKEEKA